MNESKLAEDLKTLAGRFQAIFDLAAYLEQVGSLEQAARDAKSRQDAAYKAAGEAVACLDEKIAQVAQVQGQLDDQAVKLEALKAAAAAAGNEILQKASSAAQALTLRAELDRQETEDATAAAKKDLALLNDAVVAKNNELKSVEGQIQAIKAQVAALVRG